MQKFCALLLTISLFTACSKNTSIETGGNNNNGGNNGGNNNGNNGGNNGGNNSGGSNTATYYIKASIDGTTTTFDVMPAATLTSAFGLTSLGLTAASSSQAVIVFNIGALPGKTIGPGTYTETDISSFIIGGTYASVPGSLTSSYTAGNGLSYDNSNPLKIVISAMDSKTVKGTFSGNFWGTTSTGQTNSTKKTFSNGEFNLQIK